MFLEQNPAGGRKYLSSREDFSSAISFWGPKQKGYRPFGGEKGSDQRILGSPGTYRLTAFISSLAGQVTGKKRGGKE